MEFTAVVTYLLHILSGKLRLTWKAVGSGGALMCPHLQHRVVCFPLRAQGVELSILMVVLLFVLEHEENAFWYDLVYGRRMWNQLPAVLAINVRHVSFERFNGSLRWFALMAHHFDRCFFCLLLFVFPQLPVFHHKPNLVAYADYVYDLYTGVKVPVAQFQPEVNGYCCKRFDVPFPVEFALSRVMVVLAAQGYNFYAVIFLLAVMGRMLFKLGQRDNWIQLLVSHSTLSIVY